MQSRLQDLEEAETHWHDLQSEAEHERLVREALRQPEGPQPEGFFSRLLRLLKADRRARPSDPRVN